MVTLPRRLAALLIALIATVSITGTALGSPRDVINDFLADGAINVCHSKADYDGARTEDVQSTYGDFQGALDDASANPTLVGTEATPCPATPTENDDDGIGGAALVAIPIGLGIVALALVLGARRRHAGDGDDDTDNENAAADSDPPA